MKSNLDHFEPTVFLDGFEQPVGILVKSKEILTTYATTGEIRITTLEATGRNLSSSVASTPRGIAYVQDKFICVGADISLLCAKEASPLVFKSVYKGSEQVNHLVTVTPGFRPTTACLAEPTTATRPDETIEETSIATTSRDNLATSTGLSSSSTVVERQYSQLYFALQDGTIMALSPETLETNTIRSTGADNLLGMAYDPTRNKIYWSTASHTIYRVYASNSRSDVEVVLSTTQCKLCCGYNLLSLTQSAIEFMQ